MLRFAAAFREATEAAERLDQSDDGVHHKLLMSELQKAVRSSDPSIWSRWNTIGSQAKVLLTYSKSLPPQRDSLYEVALAAKDKKPISKWIEGEKITSESSVRDIRALRKPSKKAAKRTKSEAAAGRNFNAQVVLFFESFDEAAECLRELHSKHREFEVQRSNVLQDALVEKMNGEDFEKIKKRFR